MEHVIENEPAVVVLFTAPAWCAPCQKFAPHYERASNDSDATFVKVDVDNAPWAMAEYGVQSVPTVKLFYDGAYARDIQERTVVSLLNENKL